MVGETSVGVSETPAPVPDQLAQRLLEEHHDTAWRRWRINLPDLVVPRSILEQHVRMVGTDGRVPHGRDAAKRSRRKRTVEEERGRSIGDGREKLPDGWGQWEQW